MVSNSSKTMLREKARDPTAVEDGTQKRGICYTAVTSNAGELLMCITHITDHAFNGTDTKNRKPAELYPVSCNYLILLIKPYLILSTIIATAKRTAAPVCAH